MMAMRVTRQRNGCSPRTFPVQALRRSATALAILLLFPAIGRAQDVGTTRGDTLIVSLDQCLEIARQRSPALGEAKERLYSAEGGYGLARSGLLPRASLSSGADRYEAGLYVDPVTQIRYVDDHSYSAGLRINQALFHGGANWKDLSAAEHNREAARSGLEEARLGANLDVRVAYLELLRAQHLLHVAEEALDESRHRQERVEALYAVGSVARADVLQNRVQLAEDQLAQIQARNAVELRQAELLSAMGLTVYRPIEVKDVPVETEIEMPADYRSLLAEAESANHGLGDLREQLSAGQDNLSAARGEQYPQLDFQYSYQWNNTRLSLDRWDENARWTASLFMSFNLFDGLATRSRIAQARHNMRRTEFQLEQQKLSLALDVKQQHSSLMEARERTKVAQESVASAEERLRLEEERYRLGAATLLELIEAQVALTRARSGVVEAQYDFALAQARLNRALGRE